MQISAEYNFSPCVFVINLLYYFSVEPVLLINLFLFSGMTMEDMTMEEYLVEEQGKLLQGTGASMEKLWYLRDDDDECETYEVNLCEFPAVRIHDRASEMLAWNNVPMCPAFDEAYDAIICDLPPELDYLFASRFQAAVPVCSIESFYGTYAREEIEFDILAIGADLFAWETPLEATLNEFKRLSSMEDDLFTYDLMISYTKDELLLLWPIMESKGLVWTTIEEDEDRFRIKYDTWKPRLSSRDTFVGKIEQVETTKPSYFPYIEQQYDNLEGNNLDDESMYANAEILLDNRLVKLMDITLEQWLDLKYGNRNKVTSDVIRSIVSTWLTRSFKMQFIEYMEIKKRLLGAGVNTDIDFDPADIDFAEWLASKFSNYQTMDRATKNILWLYWLRGDDEEVLTNEELTDNDDSSTFDEAAELFRIETNLFDYETPLCKEFKEFNYLLKIEDDVLTGDLPGFKTYDDYKNTWLYEWNSFIPWVHEKPWEEDMLEHKCKPIRFKNGHETWPTCNWEKDGFCNGGDLPGMKRVGENIYFQNYEWYDLIEDSEWKNKALIEKAKLEAYEDDYDIKNLTFLEWVHRNFDDYSKLDQRLQWKLRKEWEELQDGYEPNNEMWSDYSPDEENIHDIPKAHDDCDMEELKDYLLSRDESYFVNKEEEAFKERKHRLLGIPYEKPPTFMSEKFEVIKYSFGPLEEYAAVKMHEYDIWVRTEENVSQAYHDIFRKKDEGWFVARTK